MVVKLYKVVKYNTRSNKFLDNYDPNILYTSLDDAVAESTVSYYDAMMGDEAVIYFAEFDDEPSRNRPKSLIEFEKVCDYNNILYNGHWKLYR